MDLLSFRSGVGALPEAGWLRFAWGGLLDLLWPRVCFLCGCSLAATALRWICLHCSGALPLFGSGDRLCPRCAAPLGEGVDERGCRDCARLRPKFVATVVAGAYRGGLRRLVTGLKYARRREHVWPLAELMAVAMAAEVPRLGNSVAGWTDSPGPVLVAVPSTAAARRRRGYDPPALLSEELSALLGLPFVSSVLERVGSPQPQASLPLVRRLRAPRGTVSVVRPGAVAGRIVVLVDDVVTTGATASEAARVLREAGATAVIVLACARTVSAGRFAGR